MGRWFNNKGDGVLIYWSGDKAPGWLCGCDKKWIRRSGSESQDARYLIERDEAYALEWLKARDAKMPPSFKTSWKAAGGDDLDGAAELRAAVEATRVRLGKVKNQVQLGLRDLQVQSQLIRAKLTIAKH